MTHSDDTFHILIGTRFRPIFIEFDNFLKDLDDSFNEMKRDMKSIIQEKYNKIINELDNSTELKYF